MIGRNQTKGAFETFWQTTLPSNVIYINGFSVVGSNGFPVINGDETYSLQNASSVTIDGPTVAMPASPGAQSIKRTNANASASLETSWSRSSQTTGNPGTGMTTTNSGKLIISEFSDASTFNNEFVEIFYDVTSAPKGQGTILITPPRWKYNSLTNLRFVLKTESDTLRGLRFIKPSLFEWDVQNISVEPNTAVVSQSSDTVTIRNFTLISPDTFVVTIAGVNVADTTETFSFGFQSSNDSLTFLPIQTDPKTLVYGNPRLMNVVKQKNQSGAHVLLGKWAVVRGVVTVANEFGGPSYLQDSSAAIAVFDSSVSNNITRGDDVILLGIVSPFNDLFELAPCNVLERISEGNPVDTVVLTASQVNSQTASEPYEGRLMRINNVTVNTSTWSVTGSGFNYLLTDATGQLQIRISSRINLAGLPAPSGQFDVVGVLGQFTTNYQILPRSYDDIIVEGQGPRIISQVPFETAIAPTSLTFSWKTDVPGTSTIRYGKTTSYGSQQTDTNRVTQHELTVTGLTSASVYNVQLESANEGGTSTTANYIVSTSSLSSTGAINVYFNKSVSITVAQGENAQGNVNLSQKLIDRVNAASYSIDVCLYSLSGIVGANVAQALVNAKNRAVKVRVIGEKDNQSTVPWTTLKNNGITVIDDGYDALNGGAGLMHNKFLVFDNRDTVSEADDWVWTGSWNTTDPGTNDDFQNAIEIQDKALANAYTLEFNEMWGSDNDSPNSAASRFGSRKLDNTPHHFVINGIPVESSFSPSDRTTNRIIKTIDRTVHSVNFALLTFTRTDIRNALVAQKNAGRKVRGVMDNRTDQGSQFDSLAARGVDVRLDVNSAFLHHKYSVIDAETVSPLQFTITGSHNWSSSAENSNNENTMILQSQRIANLYLQEFKARYMESGGTDNIVVKIERVEGRLPNSFSLSQNYPNPFNPTTKVEFSIPQNSVVSLKVYDVMGREIAVLLDAQKEAGTYRVSWDASALSSGVYFCRIHAGPFLETKKMLLMR
ncbi:MAG: T9SS type A sorting domain-containing protein [Ignavibacteriales bacterium]|nr:T9SS type A sorting domain-containing protein [Ignavibacteriales bacterium]